MQSLTSAQELEKTGINFTLIPLSQSVHSVQDVQNACNCKAEEVIKTLVLIGKNPIIVMLPGNKKADLEKIKIVIGEEALRMAKPDKVIKITGFSVGAVSPFGIISDVRQIADNSIMDLSDLFLGSGKSDVLIKIGQDDFKNAFRGSYASISI